MANKEQKTRTEKQANARAKRRIRQHSRKRIRRWLFLALVGTASVAIIAGLIVPQFLSPSAKSGSTAGLDSTGPGEHPPLQPRLHIDRGQAHPPYNSSPATSGWHYYDSGAPVPWGMYEMPLLDEITVHNLEHGGINIFFNTDDEQLIDQLKALALRQQGFPCYLITAPYPGMNQKVALAAWGAVEYFDRYDDDLMQEFIDFYRNNGPERVLCNPEDHEGPMYDESAGSG